MRTNPEDDKQTFEIKQPHSLSSRIRWLRDFYFQGLDRPWNNEWTCWTTGTPWDVLYDEISYYIVPESLRRSCPGFPFSSALQAARPVELDPRLLEAGAWSERRAWFIKRGHGEATCRRRFCPAICVAGARFNILASRCWTEGRGRQRAMTRRSTGRTREPERRSSGSTKHGYGNAGATAGHLIPDHERAAPDSAGRGVYEELENRSTRELSSSENGAHPRARSSAP